MVVGRGEKDGGDRGIEEAGASVTLSFEFRDYSVDFATAFCSRVCLWGIYLASFFILLP